MERYGNQMAKVGIIGAGSWGTALSWLLHNNGNEVTMWSVMEDEIHMLKECHEQKDKLPGVILSRDTVFTTNLEEAAADKDVLVLAVPSPFTRSTAAMMDPRILPIPPSTTNTRIRMDMLYPKFLGSAVSEDKLCA